MKTLSYVSAFFLYSRLAYFLRVMNVVINIVGLGYLKLVHTQIWFFAVGLFIFFQVLFISFVERKASSTIEQQKCDRLLISKVDSNFQFSQMIIKYAFWSSFLKLG